MQLRFCGVWSPRWAADVSGFGTHTWRYEDADQMFAVAAVIYLVAYQILQILDTSLTISRPEHFHNGQPYVNPSAPNSRDTTPELDASGDANSSPPKAVNTEEEEIVEGITTASKRWRGPKRPHGQSSAIELRLVGAVLIAFKLIYGLDGTPR
jgi:hypothetical protein